MYYLIQSSIDVLGVGETPADAVYDALDNDFVIVGMPPVVDNEAAALQIPCGRLFIADKELAEQLGYRINNL